MAKDGRSPDDHGAGAEKEKVASGIFSLGIKYLRQATLASCFCDGGRLDSAA